MQYPLTQQQQLVAAVANLTSQGNTTLPLLLQANAFISDVLALSFADSIDPSAILEVADAVASSQAASTGFGLFLLVQPVVDALQQLVLFSEVRLACEQLHSAALRPCTLLDNCQGADQHIWQQISILCLSHAACAYGEQFVQCRGSCQTLHCIQGK